MTTDAVGAAPLARHPDQTWAARLTAAWASAKRLYLFLLPLRFSFLALAVVGFAFIVSDQGHDIIAAMTENDPRSIDVSSHPLQRLFFVPLVSFLAVQIWYWSRTLLRLCAPGAPAASEFPRLAAFMPRALGVLAYVVMLAALYRVGREYGRGGEQPLHTLWVLAAWLAAAAVLFVIFCVRRRRLLEKRGKTVTKQKELHELSTSTWWALGISFFVAIAFFVASCLFVQQTGTLGSMAIVLLAMALWVSFGSILVFVGMKARMPILTLLLLVAVLSSRWADNHVLRTLSGTSDLVSARPTVTQAFDRWSARLAHDYPAEGTHPVFIVATEGGGIRAAYWTAAVLTALDDGIPGFRDHLFAVSGVSGGSVGAATYASLVTRQVDSPGALPRLRPAAQRMLAHDALAPTLAAMTQQDFVQRFIAYPFLPDRARALEGGWERAWQETNAGDDRFGQGFLTLMHGREDRMPSLFLNGTAVETGERMIGSNCRITPAEFSDALDVFAAAGFDLRVSTTAHNSARFTYVSPAGTFLRNPLGYPGSPYDCKPGKRCEHVVDGGYFDNSGAITAAEIVNVIRRRAAQNHVAIAPYVLVIRYLALNPAPVAPELWANEALSPVRALANARGSRAVLAVAQLTPLTDTPVIQFRLLQYPNTVPMPLGWLLSLHTRGAIDAQMGRDAKENGPAMAAVAALLQRTAMADPTQQSAAAAPTVKRITARP
ncbi:MAG TPA: hypothetical protein VGG03_26020 [Thermoanaerobaculia bacterium]|jgi:hypothetical protein